MITLKHRTKTFFATLEKSAAVFLIAALFLSVPSRAEHMELAAELFEQQDWRLCVRELRRVLADSPSNFQARVMQNICALRLERSPDRASASLAEISKNDQLPPETRALASYECGRFFKKKQRFTAAFTFLTNAFFLTGKESVSVGAAESLNEIFEHEPQLEREHASLRGQVRSILSHALYDAPSDQSERTAWSPGNAAGSLVVSFYRTLVGPALGERCSLHPSCSQYFLHACTRHGILGFPMQADRFVREPGVAQRREKPVLKGNAVKYADPLSDHDFWFNNKQEEHAQ